MWSNYVTTALRSFARYKLHFVLNIAGLTIGLAAAILMALYASHEASYDRFLPDAERVYRVEQYFPQLNGSIPLTNKNTMNRLRDSVEDILLLEPLPPSAEFRMGDNSYKLNGILGASSNIQDFLPLQVVAGDLTKALTTPGMLAISQSLATRLFGHNDPLGAQLLQSDTSWTIVAIFADLPDNTHFSFQALFQLKPYQERYSGNNSYAYVRLPKAANTAAIERQLQQDYIHIAYPGETSESIKLSLHAMTDIHLSGSLRLEMKPTSSKANLMICICLSALLVTLASFNFVNMSIAQSARRAKEVGIRKAMGAKRYQIISQFLTESLLITLLAGLLACAVAELALPWFNALVERQLALNYFSSFGVGLILVMVATGLAAGLYPAFFMAAFSAKRVLSGDLHRGSTAVLVRKGLLTLQSALSVGLIIAAMLLQQQLTYLQKLDLGYNRQGLIQVTDIPSEHLLSSPNPQLLQRILAIPGVLEAGAVDISITSSFNASMPLSSDNGVLQEQTVPFIGVGFQPVKLLGLQLIAGRDFSEATASDWYHEPTPQTAQASILLTESLARQAGFASAQDAIGHQFSTMTELNGKTYQFTIVGVVKDIKVGSARGSQPSALLVCGYTVNWFSHLLMQVDMQQLPAIRLALGNVLGPALNIYAPTIEVLEDEYLALYSSDLKTASFTSIFSGLAIVLACFGIFGLASFSALRRQKEVAIRKVLGASRMSIINLLAGEFLRLVLVSVIIAYPLTWWFVRDWLAGFNQRIDQQWWVYLLAAFSVAFITWLTVSAIAFQAAARRPAEILRSE